MRIHVAFTPAETGPAPIGVVVDVLRATSAIAQALASGYQRVLCCAEIEDALALREQIPDSLVGGERKAVQVEGFDVGASPREFLEARADALNARTYGPPGLEEDIVFCARENVLDIVPRLVGMVGPAAEITAA